MLSLRREIRLRAWKKIKPMSSYSQVAVVLDVWDSEDLTRLLGQI